MKKSLIICFLLGLWGLIPAQNINHPDWEYLPIDSNKQKWGDWAEPEWLRYFGLDAGDVDRDGNLDILAGRYIYHNPGGTMNGQWPRTTLDDNVDGIFVMNVDNDPFADIIGMALPHLYWYEAIDETGTRYRRTEITQVPATSHVNSQGFERADIIPGGQEEILIAGNGNVYLIQIPDNPDETDKWPTSLIGANTSDEGIGVGDIDGDGDMDISCGRRPEGEGEPTILVWFENPGTYDSPWQDHLIGNTKHPIDRIEIADFNGDGQADIAMAEERYPGLEPDGSIFWFSPENNPEGRWKKNVIVTQYSSNNMDIADIDEDGDIDLLTGEHKGKKLELQLWENDGKGNFSKKILDTGKENHLGTQWVDLDADGDLDIIGAAWDNYRWTHVWRNDRIKSFAPGSIFKEYNWRRDSEAKEDYLRVGGNYDYQIYSNFFPAEQHKDGYIPLAENIDLNQAIRAELIIERLQSHEGTQGLEIQLNDQDWLSVKKAPLIPAPAYDYMSHFNAKVAVPLEFLNENQLSFRFRVNPKQHWDWPQNIIYGVILRVYYADKKQTIHASINGIKDHETLNQTQELTLNTSQVSEIKQVDYVGLYEDINWQGDGQYRQWQYLIHKAEISKHIGSSTSAPFSVSWNTESLPDQQHPISIMARVKLKNGVTYLTEAIENLKLERDYSVNILKPYQQPAMWVTRSGEFSESLYLENDPDDISATGVFWRSWSPCYSEGITLNGQLIIKGQVGPCYRYYEHKMGISDWYVLNQGENELKTLLTPKKDEKLVHGMEVQWPGIMLKIKRDSLDKEIKITETQYEGAPHFLVHTPQATYYFDKAGGGFSRIIDKTGNDWVNFKKEPWGEYPPAAASSFRGLPNMVFQGNDDGAGHPGHKKCRSIVKGNQIITETISGRWKWAWTFEADHAKLEVLKTDSDRKYWFLYEGTPGGKYQPGKSYFGTNKRGPSKDLYDFYQGNLLKGQFQWMYSGVEDQNQVFYLAHLNSDENADIISFLGNTETGIESKDGMTVWGFGRDADTNPLLSGKQQFVIGFYPAGIQSTSEHKTFSDFLEQRFFSGE